MPGSIVETYNEFTQDAFDASNKIKPQDDQGPAPPADDSLLAMPPEAAARQMLKDWDDSWKDLKSIAEQWKANKARLDGYTGVQIIKRQDHNEAFIPLGARKNVGGLNKAARLLRRVCSNVFSDKPEPDCTPAGDDDAQRDAAESGTRILQWQCGEGQLDYALGALDSFRLGGVYGSGFLRFWVDPNGGGFLPQQIEANPHAQSPQDPFPVDPQTGVKAPCDPILRYVTTDGQFTEDRKAANRIWYPKLKREVLTGKNVRLIPFQVRDIWEADGVMVGCVTPLKTIKDTFPDVAKWPQERLARLTSARPQHFKDLLPQGQKDYSGGEVKDTTLCFLLMRWHVQSPKYPNGAYLVAAGAKELLYKGNWFDEEHVRPLDIPLTQFKQLAEEDNPYGSGLMTDLGPGNEIRDAMLLAELEHLDRFNNRKVFVSMVSPMAGNPQLLQAPTGFPIPIMPGTEPKYEEIPDFPVIVEKMLQFASLDMDDESGLQQQAQALNAPSVTSGKQAETILQTVRKGLSDLWDNTERGLVRGWRIMMQLDRAFIGDVQLLRFQGPDGAFKLERWTGEDFGDTEDVQVQRGTFTGMSPEQKAQQAVSYAQLGLMSKEDLEHVTEGSVGGLLGLQDNPHRLRVRRQIAQWQDGPPEGWQPPPPPMPAPPALPGQPPAPPQPPAPDPVLGAIFAPQPTDTQPDIAHIRMYELARAVDGTSITRWGPEWAQALIQAYTSARQAAQILDAEASQKLQEENKGQAEKLQQQSAKLAEKPSFSIALKAGFELDQNQVAALMQQEGIQLVPGGIQPPQLDPNAQFQAQAQLESQKIEAEVVKHRTTESAKVEQARIKGQAQVQRTQAKAQKPAKPAPNFTVQSPAIPAPNVTIVNEQKKEGAKRVVRDAQGKVTGVEPVE